MRFLILAAVLAASPAATAQRLTAAESTAIDALVTDTLATSGVPSAQVAVVRGGRLVFSRAYGKASDTQPRATADQPYQIASISKQFTAAALLLLEDDGRLSLDDKVAKYMPEVSGAEAITLRQLLDHTSGLRDYWPQDYSFAAMARPTTPQGIVERWAKGPLDFAPGSQWQYSNTGYVVAGMIVEKVSGQPLLAFLDRRVFQPLGMRVISQDKAIGAGFPQGYGRYALGPVRAVTPAAPGWLYAAGEMAVSAADLAKWNIARIERRVLPADDWQAQETPTKLNDGTSTDYGLGVRVVTPDGRRMIEHSGESVGFLSENMVFPDQKTAITVLTNSWSAGAYRTIAQGLVRIVMTPPAGGGSPDAAYAAKARRIFDQLRTGTLDRKLLTEDANYYFTPVALADFRASLAPLGEPRAFEPVGKPTPRGGYVARTYRVTYPDRALIVSTFTEPRADGRFEQFLVSQAQ